MRLDGLRAEQTVSATRPAGTSALIYAVLALVAGALGVLVGVVYPLAAIAGFAVLAAALVALVVGVVKRLAGGSAPRPDVRLLAAWAFGPVVAALLASIVIAFV